LPSGRSIRYYESEKALIKIRPAHVLAACIAFVALEIALFALFRF